MNKNISVLAVALAGPLIAILFVAEMLQSADMLIYISVLVVGTLLLSMIFILRQNYWILIPFVLTANAGAIPLGTRTVSLAELSIPIFAILFVFYTVIPKGLKGFLRLENIFVLLYVLWAFIRYLLEDIGLAVLQGTGGGARAYIKIGLAFIAFIIIKNQVVDEKRSKWIVGALILAAFIGTAFSLIRYYLGLGGMAYIAEESGSFYTWHQSLALIPVLLIPCIFAKWSPGELLKGFRFLPIILLVGLYVAAAVSGKRAVLMACLLAPLFASFLRREVVLFLTGVLGLFITCVMIVYLSFSFSLPLTVQRSMAWLPGDWSNEVINDTDNSYRDTLNTFALIEIDKNPYLGSGFKITASDVYLLKDFQVLNQLKHEWEHAGAFASAYAGNYHSTWLGISATLGIPAALLIGLMYMQGLVLGIKQVKRFEFGSSMSVLVQVVTYMLLVSLARSFTSGHAAESYLSMCWMLGLLFSIRNSHLPEKPNIILNKES